MKWIVHFFKDLFAGVMLWIMYVVLYCGVVMGEVKIIAHRGASVEAPENTISAFKQAMEIGVDGVECDVHLTKDGIPVISHDHIIPYDPQRSRISIPNMRFADLQLYDVGNWFHAKYYKERIPTLTEVLELAHGKTAVMIEVKKGENDKKKLVETIVEHLKDEGAAIYVGSFDPQIVALLQEKKCPAHIMGICSTYHNFHETFLNPPKYVAMGSDYVTKHVVDTFHREGREVWTYTVDSPLKAKRLVEYGVDGVITNDPRAVKEALHRQ